ncbi:nitrogen fixation protein FixH [Ramlibacter sp. 2FC]|uniref:nitrogen fixation protein FixH n=1 Tax=Ramlibacter sp. 2FC TaxID=2502188 RepID=UPI0010F478D3|nr:nitrogen fixation protein FixH [Ramlibacter sp. 2FC]
MQDRQAQPWWKHGHVWLLIAGPAIVVVAGFVTLFLALRTPDPVIGGHGPAQQAGQAALAPALQARNHAATGVPAQPAAARP